MAERTAADLKGRRILVVEDEYLIAADLVRSLRDHGAEVVGPAPTVERAMRLLEASGRLDGAVLDISLDGEMVYPVADALERANVPFVFATGYDALSVPGWYGYAPRCEKPVDAGALARALANRMTGGAGA
jgi:CheY-like chemotaxis protein